MPEDAVGCSVLKEDAGCGVYEGVGANVVYCGVGAMDVDANAAELKVVGGTGLALSLAELAAAFLVEG